MPKLEPDFKPKARLSGFAMRILLQAMVRKLVMGVVKLLVFTGLAVVIIGLLLEMSSKVRQSFQGSVQAATQSKAQPVGESRPQPSRINIDSGSPSIVQEELKSAGKSLTRDRRTKTQQAVYNPGVDLHGNTWPDTTGYLPQTPLLNANGHFTLSIANSTSSSLLVHLVDVTRSPNVVVRQMLIQKNTTFQVKNITAGTYKLRQMNIWSGVAREQSKPIVASARPGTSQVVTITTPAGNHGVISRDLLQGRAPETPAIQTTENLEDIFLARIARVFLVYLRGELQKTQKNNPALARNLRDKHIEFIVTTEPSGQVLRKQLVRSSGDGGLDQAVQRLVPGAYYMEGMRELSDMLAQPYRREFRVRINRGELSVHVP